MGIAAQDGQKRDQDPGRAQPKRSIPAQAAPAPPSRGKEGEQAEGAGRAGKSEQARRTALEQMPHLIDVERIGQAEEPDRQLAQHGRKLEIQIAGWNRGVVPKVQAQSGIAQQNQEVGQGAAQGGCGSRRQCAAVPNRQHGQQQRGQGDGHFLGQQGQPEQQQRQNMERPRSAALPMQQEQQGGTQVEQAAQQIRPAHDEQHVGGVNGMQGECRAAYQGRPRPSEQQAQQNEQAGRVAQMQDQVGPVEGRCVLRNMVVQPQ